MSSDEHVNEQKHLDDVSIDSESFIEIRKFSEDEKKEEQILVKVNDFKTSCNMLFIEQRSYKVQIFKKKNDVVELFQEVERRFSDFEWLYCYLKHKFPGILIPQLPNKSALGKLNKQIVDTITNEFLENRKISLQIFLKKIITHPKLLKDSYLQAFIQEDSMRLRDQYTSDRTQQENSSVFHMNEIKKQISSGYSFFNSFFASQDQKQQLQRAWNENDYKYQEIEDKFALLLVDLQQINCLISNTIQNKNKLTYSMGEMSDLLKEFQLPDENSIVFTKVLPEISKCHQLSTSVESITNKNILNHVYFPLKEHERHLEECLTIFHDRKNLQDDIFQIKNQLQQQFAEVILICIKIIYNF